MNTHSAPIMSINRLRTGTDGKGITTLVAFRGCPLHCRYCINQECHKAPAETDYMMPEKLLDYVKLDDIYYSMTGGGITFGGGEPLLRASFISEFCDIAPKRWKIRIETSLYAPWEEIAPLTYRIDQWFIDIKALDPNIYREYTGAGNQRVLDNLRRLVKSVGARKVHVRVPRIPGFNTDEDVEKTEKYLEQYSCTIENFEYTVSHDRRP